MHVFVVTGFVTLEDLHFVACELYEILQVECGLVCRVGQRSWV